MALNTNIKLKHSYFRQLPDLEYPSLDNNRKSIFDYNKVKNIFKRAIIREDLFNSFTTFEKYTVQGNERPDDVANRVYGNSYLDWVVLLTNNITNIREQWPLSDTDLNNYLNEKYSSEQLSQIHHYETLEIRDSSGRLIQPSGYFVDANHSVTYLDNGIYYTKSSITSMTYLQYEIALNDKKREINLLKDVFLQTVLDDIEDIMVYKNSSQYINKYLKKTENPRITK